MVTTSTMRAPNSTKPCPRCVLFLFGCFRLAGSATDALLPLQRTPPARPSGALRRAPLPRATSVRGCGPAASCVWAVSSFFSPAWNNDYNYSKSKTRKKPARSPYRRCCGVPLTSPRCAQHDLGMFERMFEGALLQREEEQARPNAPARGVQAAGYGRGEAGRALVGTGLAFREGPVQVLRRLLRGLAVPSTGTALG